MLNLNSSKSREEGTSPVIRRAFGWERVFLSLGSNVEESRLYLQKALDALKGVPGVDFSEVSGFYRTEPIGMDSERWFLNCVAEVYTSLAPLELLDAMEDIEVSLGRRNKSRNAERTIDIDIILYGSMVVAFPRLKIPHPRMAERRFVLEPLAEIAPEAVHPVLRRNTLTLCGEVSGQTVYREELENSQV